jgi:ribosomal-protein-alanine N-acetyltransferase
VVCLKGTSAHAGYVVLRPFTWDNQFDGTEIGYIIDRAFWGKGIASMAVKAVMEFALNELKLPQLLALVNDENTASIKIVEKLGFKRSPAKPKNYRDNSVWIKDSE